MMLRTSFIIFLNTIKSVLCCQRLLRFVTNQICLRLAASCSLSQYMSIQGAFTKEVLHWKPKFIALEGNIADEGNIAKWPLRNGVMCVTRDGTCSTWGDLGGVCL
jgi:hypothetical protein